MDVKIYKVEISGTSGYCYYPEYKKRRDKLELIKDVLENAGVTLLPYEEPKYKKAPESPEEGYEPEYDYHSYPFLESRDVFLTAEEFLKVAEVVDCKIVRTFTKSMDISRYFQQVDSKLEEQLAGLAGNTYNSHCEVHMPGMALSTYNEVCLLEDACSDELQRNISVGWRIIAACPQPDQRRPDYILGRFNANLQQASDSASRGEK